MLKRNHINNELNTLRHGNLERIRNVSSVIIECAGIAGQLALFENCVGLRKISVDLGDKR